MDKEEADIIRQQLEQKPPPYEDVQISSTSVHASVTVIPPGIHGDVTSFKVEGTHVSIKQVERQMLKEYLIMKILFLVVSQHLKIIRMISLLQYQLVYCHKPVHRGHLLCLHQPHLLLLLLLTCPLPLK